MGYLWVFAALLLFLMIKSFQEGKKKLRQLEAGLRENFGQVPQEEYSEEKYTSIGYFFYSKGVTSSTIDDITWHDLDMDEIYLLLNQTSCAMGEEYLYDLLRRPLQEDEPLLERERLIAFFEAQEEERLKLQLAFTKIGKFPRISLYKYYNKARKLEIRSIWPDVAQAVLLPASIVVAICLPQFGGLLVVLMLAAGLVTYFKRKKEIEPYVQVFAYLVRLTEQVTQFGKMDVPSVLAPYLERLLCASQTFSSFRKMAWLINSGSSMSGSMLDIVLDYVRMLLHVDLIKFHSMQRCIKEHGAELDIIYETIGLLDSMIAAASFRAYLGDTCQPELTEGMISLEAEHLYHPLLTHPVKNSIQAGRGVLVTGSNASGKSTFLKTLAVNAILAQTIHTVAADGYRAGYFRIYSSMALTDNLIGGESYYIVEIKSLKRILDAAQKEAVPVLCFIDEVLRGTNTLERIAASSQILSVLARMPVLAFAATHDLELTQILANQYDNYHFSEEVQENDVHFDYRLKKGCAQSRNAIRLLRLLGFSEGITKAAEERAEAFLQTGEWKR